MTDKDVLKFYHKHKIYHVKLDLIRDFLHYLLNTVEETYLGDDLMTTQNKKEHFEYCLRKTIDFFNNAGIFIRYNPDLEEEFFNIFFKYYYDTKKTKNNIQNFKTRITNIYSYNLYRKKSQLDNMLRSYRLFNNSMGDILIF